MKYNLVIKINIIRDKIEKLSKEIIFLKEKFKYYSMKEEYDKIKKKLKCIDIWNFPIEYNVLFRKKLLLKKKVNTINSLSNDLVEISDLFDLFIAENEKEFFFEIINELNKIEKKINDLKLKYIFSMKNDILNCYFTLQSGSGGVEAQDWTNILMRMYLRWFESKKFNIEILEMSYGEIKGLKSATFRVVGKYSYGWIRTENGIHRLVRKSPFDSGGRRHTSFSSVSVYPEIKNNIKINFNLSDLRIDVYKSSGAGGQHVNKTESAVRLTHIPTGIVVKCQNNRSQHKNKDQAIKQLKSKLYDLEMKIKNKDKKDFEKNKSDIAWGNQIRSYILDDSRIKDLRTGVETRNISSVLNGDLDIFVLASLKAGL